MSDDTNIDATTTDTTATTPAAETPAPTPEDVFANAFAEFASPGEKQDETVAPPVAAEAPAEEAAEEVEATAEEAPPAPQEPETPPPAQPEQQRQPTPEEVQAYYAALQAQQAQQTQPQAQPEQPLLAQEEIATLTEFRKEWPDVAKAVDIQSRVLAHQVIDYVFKEFAKEITPRLAQLEELAERTHFEDVYNAVDDYDDIRDKVIGWVQQQPDYLRNAYGHVVQNGTPDQIADLIGRWRAETGQMQQAQQVAAPRPQQRREPAPELRRAAAALAPVASKRSTAIRVDDPNDFDSAWDRFAKHQ